MDNFKRIGEFIKSKREEKGMSQDILAEKLNVSKSTVSLYEAGMRKPTLDRLSQIAKILETSINEFLALDQPSRDKDLEQALRAEDISNDDIQRIKNYIEFVKDASKTEPHKSKKES